MVKICNLCNVEKQLTEFRSAKNGKHGKGSTCKPCVNKRAKQYRLNDPNFKSKTKIWNSRRTYISQPSSISLKKAGITREQYMELYFKQNGLCRICKNSAENQVTKRKWLCVDHCHKTGQFRGLICGKCNMALGLLDDSVENLYAAIEYLSCIII